MNPFLIISIVLYGLSSLTMAVLQLGMFVKLPREFRSHIMYKLVPAMLLNVVISPVSWAITLYRFWKWNQEIRRFKKAMQDGSLDLSQTA